MGFRLVCINSTWTHFEGQGQAYALFTETGHYSSDLRIFSFSNEKRLCNLLFDCIRKTSITLAVSGQSHYWR